MFTKKRLEGPNPFAMMGCVKGGAMNRIDHQNQIIAMSREERARRLGISVDALDEIRAAAMKIGRKVPSIQDATSDDSLLNLKQAARKLGITEDQTRGLIRNGELDFINLGLGKKLPRMRFTEADIEDLKKRRRRRISPCLSTSRRNRRITNMTSKLEAIGFTARRSAQLARTPKASKQ
jgi:helix-turn-helix protein